MSLWNRKRHLNQPPHFGRVGQQREPTPKADAAARAVRESQFKRQDVTKRLGQRAVVRG
jgi:hypothetical protein